MNDAPAHLFEPSYERQPPANFEAEQALLAAILANNFAYEKVADFLLPEHFADPAHGRIYEACATLIDRGHRATAVTLKNKFDQDGDLAAVGGSQYLVEMAANYVNIVDVRHYGLIVYDLFLRRHLIDLGEDLVNDACRQDLDSSAEQQIALAEERLYRLSEARVADTGPQGFDAFAGQYVAACEDAYKRGGALAGVASGFDSWDDKIGGLQGGHLIIMAGRPAMGKTSAGLDISINVARQAKQETPQGETAPAAAYFSLEMGGRDLAGRVIGVVSGIPSDRAKKGRFSREEFGQIEMARRELSGLPLAIDETENLSVPQIRARARRLKRKRGLKLIVVDYLQLIATPNGKAGERRDLDIGAMTRGLKMLAKELDVPVILLCQLSRAVEQREDKRPQMSDLRDAGQIEQDADSVTFLYREHYYLKDARPAQKQNEKPETYEDRLLAWETRVEQCECEAEWNVAKNRHGPTGRCIVAWDGPLAHFSNYDWGQREQRQEAML